MSGETILITRPKEDGEALTDALHERGFRVVHEPLTEIFLKHTARHEVEAALAENPEAVLVTSRHGVYALSVLTELRDMALVCVGEETAYTAGAAGFTRVSCGGNNVEKLIDFVLAAYDEGSRFLYVSADQVRTDLSIILKQSFMRAARVVVYEALASEQMSEIVVERLRRRQVNAVTFFSQRSAHIFATLLEKAGIEQATEYLRAFTLSDSIAGVLRERPWRGMHVAGEPTLASLVESVDNAFRGIP